ncbi:hypothetical protein MOQ_002742 [Trypanosoma cruzi marinkellei]|uniref:B box-type domain-containing protein n=1 Tax=Trypanosoma cruzi marinkellei TaxID=85056 RepID=K2N5Y4_TRYCR|nr:hypothetical protein MOQ_002742 [Trypanosoma cruzi marinkellei]
MLLRLVLYVDDVRLPLEMGDTCIRAHSMSELAGYLKKVLQRPPRVILYWNFEHKRYELLTSLQTLLQRRSNGDAAHDVNADVAVLAHLWVETRPLQLDPVDPDSDLEEYAELKNHVQCWAGNKYVMFSLQSALRVTDPRNERLFDDLRCARMGGDPDHVELLYYTNNSLGSSEVLQHGFDRGGESGLNPAPLNSASPATADARLLPLFVFSSFLKDQDDKEVFPAEPHKVLLCEVALGRVWFSDVPLSKGIEAPPSGYDSVCYRMEREDRGIVKTVCVGKNFQALPRYVLTLVAKKRIRREKVFRGIHTGTGDLPATSARRRAGSVGSQPCVSWGNTSSVHSYSKRTGSAPPLVNGRRTRSPLFSTNVYCAVHSGTLLGLWCSTCGHVICPYCASVGDHRGHEVAGVEEVVGGVRGKVRGLCHRLTVQLENYQRVESQLKSQRKELLERHKAATSSVEKAFSDLRRLIENKRREWLARLHEQTHCLNEPLKEVGCVVQQYTRTIQSLEHSWERAGRQCFSVVDVEGDVPAAVVSVIYLIEASKLLKEGISLAGKRHDEGLIKAANASKQLSSNESILLHVDLSTVRRSVEHLLTEKRADPSNNSSVMAVSPAKSPGKHLVSSEREVTGGIFGQRAAATPPRSLLSLRADGKMNELPYDDPFVDAKSRARQQLFLRRLSDVCKGYVWCLRKVSNYFHHKQRRAVCSGTFNLMGFEWDLRIQAPDAKARGGTNASQTEHSGEDESVGLFLYPVGHTLRLDFRVSVFSTVCWAEWEVSGWTKSFAGKGWGIYPLLPRRELMRRDRLAWDDTLKICLAPTSDVY